MFVGNPLRYPVATPNRRVLPAVCTQPANSRLDCTGERPAERGLWRCSTRDSGGPCVTPSGALRMPTCCVDNWGSQPQPETFLGKLIVCLLFVCLLLFIL